MDKATERLKQCHFSNSSDIHEKQVLRRRERHSRTHTDSGTFDPHKFILQLSDPK